MLKMFTDLRMGAQHSLEHNLGSQRHNPLPKLQGKWICTLTQTERERKSESLATSR